MERNNENQEFINYWEYLGIPMNSPMSKIKIAFWAKFTEIEKSLNKGEKKYTAKDLEITTKAFITLSDPHLRYLHNCNIDGEPTPTTEELLEYFESFEEEREQDLDEQIEEKFRNWLRYIILKLNPNKYRNIIEDLIFIQNKLKNCKVERKKQRSLNL